MRNPVQVVSRMGRRVSIFVTLALFSIAMAAGADTVYYRTADGSWKSTEAAVTDGKLKIPISAEAAPDGQAVLVINKPEWMVLDDTTPPEISGMKVNGASRPSSTDALHLGVLSDSTAEIILGVKDDKNPIAPQGISFMLDDAPTVDITWDGSALGPPETSGRIVITLADIPAGKYNGHLTLRDMAPLTNTRTWPVEFAVMGITISEDQQAVSLANAESGFKVQPDISNQILLPNGMWSKLTTNMASKFLYPREFTNAQIISDTAEEKTVRIIAIPQDLDGNPVDDVCELEYELTVRADTPALLLTTRSINASDANQKTNPNYGWLGCPYYHTPEGKAEWGSGGDTERYHTIGNPGWLWLAPRGDGPGLLWASNQRFGEFMGGSILLYGNAGTCKPGEHVQMDMAFAAADTPEQAAEVYQDLIEKGLLTPVAPGG
jgi:hypothetical protein